MRFIFFSSFLLLSYSLHAQTGKITGKVISSKTGEALIGATVSIDSLKRAVATDLDGNYSISGLSPGAYSLSGTYVAYDKKIVSDVIVSGTDFTILNFALDPATSGNGNNVTVRTRVNRENIGALLAAQKNSSSVSDGISAELIRRTPDRTTSDVLRRVSGASIQDDRFAIIRGLNERYNAAFLNGAPLPSSESDRKAFAFNIFPSNILDNMVINKTATPDQSGEFAGGLINITTRSIPVENFTTISVSGGYNTITTFKEKFDYKGGKTDFLGFDDGTRALPVNVANLKNLSTSTPSEMGQLGKSFSNNWGLNSKKFTPNYGIQITKGLNIERNGNEVLGMLFSLTYNKTSSYSEGDRRSFEYDRAAPAAPPVLRGDFIDKIYADQILLGALANLSFKLNSRSTLNWKNILSINSDDRVIRRTGFQDASGDPNFLTRQDARWFTSNTIYSSQLIGDHILSKSNLRLNWQGSYAKVKRSIPNLRQSIYFGYNETPAFEANVASGRNSLVAENGGTMFYSTTNENIMSGKIDITQPFSLFSNRQNQLKVGFYYQNRTRNFDARLLGFGILNSTGFDRSLLKLPAERIFTAENMGKLSNGKEGFSLLELNRPSFVYDASSILSAGYAMLDQRFGRKLRAVWGVRLENFNQRLNSVDEFNVPVVINTAKLDPLPSVNLIYSLNAKQNIRASFYRTVNRPEFRELAPFIFFDFVTRYTVEGLDTLRRASIKNFDLRYEFYPGRSQLFSVSGFYKDFTNPIELVSSPALVRQAIYQNARSAKVYGVEFEVRTLLSTLFGSAESSVFNKITFSANASLLKSEITLGDFAGIISAKDLIEKRSLQGQSPYVFNSSLNYADDDR
jgi:TonB-dependent receptor